MGYVREIRRLRPVAKIDSDIGEDGVVAAGFTIDAYASLEISPAAEAARGSPTIAFLSGVADPAAVAPGAEHQWRSALEPRPRRQHPAIDRLPAPGATHNVDRAHQGP